VGWPSLQCTSLRSCYLPAAQEQLEEDLAAEEAEGGLTLDQKLLDVYSAKKEEAMARTCKLAQDRDTASARLQARFQPDAAL